MGIGALALAGCGPDGPPSLEGFGEVGDSGDFGDGDGDGDDEPGDGDGDGECLVDESIAALPNFFVENLLAPELGDDFPNYCGAGTSDYALAWTAPFSGVFVVNLYADFEGSLTVLHGGCEGDLAGCSELGFPQSVWFEAIAGETYTLIVDGLSEAWFGLELYPADVMPGTCPDGELFGPQTGAVGSTIGASFERYSDCGGQESPERTFLYIPELSGLYHIDTFGSGFDTVLYVLEGYCGGPELACNDDAVEDLASSLEIELLAGLEYTIVVDGFGGDQGEFQLEVEYAGEPGVCDDLTLIPPQLPFVASWPVEVSSQNLHHECSFASFEQRFLWTAPEDGTYRLAQTAGDNFSAVAVLLDGCAGNTQFCAFPDEPGEVAMEFDAVAGQDYVIISEWEPFEPGEVTLILDLVSDGCGEEIPGGVPIMIGGTTGGSGNDHEGSCASNPAPEHELHWTAPQDGSYRFSLEGSEYDTLMYIRDGGCEGPELACNDDTPTPFGLELWSTIELDLVAGQTVSIFIDGYNGSGEFTLAITQI